MNENVIKNIKYVKIPKYNSPDYVPIGHGIYIHRYDKFYTCGIRAEGLESQYPFEDLLDTFNVACGEYCGEKVKIGEEEVEVAEIVTSGADLRDLINIACFTSIVGKEIVNYVTKDNGISVGKKIEDSDFIINGHKINVPIIVDKWKKGENLVSYLSTYIENVLRDLFIKEQEYNIENIENIDFNDAKFIVIEDRKARLVVDNEEKKVYKEIAFDEKGFVNTESYDKYKEKENN